MFRHTLLNSQLCKDKFYIGLGDGNDYLCIYGIWAFTDSIT